MGQEKIKAIFFENPNEEFYIRQIANLTKVPKTTVSRIINKLIKDKLVIKRKAYPFNRYIANTGETTYKLKKSRFIVDKIYESGLIDYLIRETTPKLIMLYGSCAKGEFNKESDIDIFIESSETKLELKKFKLKHDVHIYFNQNIRNISKELRQNIINGIKLYGIIRL